MTEKKVMKLIDNNGKESTYDIVIAFNWLKTNKKYIVYTDNTMNNNDEVNYYAAIYYANKLEPINTNEEWDEIETRLKKIQRGCGNR